MTYSNTIPPMAELKTQAKRLRTRLKETGVDISHSASLELIAQQNGTRNWNTLRAQIGNTPPVPKVGERVTGRYLGQRFAGYVKGLTWLGQGDQYRITLHFDDPVDVVSFDSFSSFRQRVTGVVGIDGRSSQKTSDGVPQLIVDRPEA